MKVAEIEINKVDVKDEDDIFRTFTATITLTLNAVFFWKLIKIFKKILYTFL